MTTLKKARDAINKKDFENALKLSRTILKTDRNNYWALLFLGRSCMELGNEDKALQAFHKATDIDPKNPLGWTGLLTFYEKYEKKQPKDELIKIFFKLFDLETNEKKVLEYCYKLSQLSNNENVEQIANKIYDFIKSGRCSESKLNEAWMELESLLANFQNLPPKLLHMQEEILTYLTNNQKTVTKTYFEKYLTLLKKLGKDEILIFEQAERMSQTFESDTISLNWICKLFGDKYVETNNFLKPKELIQPYCERLLLMEPDSSMALMVKSILLIDEGKGCNAVGILEEVVKARSGLLHVWVLLTKTYINQCFYENAITAAFRANTLLQSLKNDNILLRNQINYLLIESLSRSSDNNHLNMALQIYEELNDELKQKCLIPFIRIHMVTGDIEKAKDLIEKNWDENNKNLILLKAQLLHNEKKLEESLNLLLSTDESANFEWCLEISSVYEDLGQTDKCLDPLTRAIEINENFMCLMKLGSYYFGINDFEKARRTFEKAYQLNPKSTEICYKLSRTYMKLKRWQSNLILLNKLTSGVININNSWAWLQLGLNYSEQGDCDKAIEQLQFVLRVDSKNTHCWEALGDAYLDRGAYMPALRSYLQSMAFGGHALYPTLQVANIKRILGEYDEAQKLFKEIVEKNETYVPALKGMADNCYCLAQKIKSNHAFARSRDYIQLAVDKSIKALLQGKSYSCLWKIIGDCCLFLVDLPEKHCHLTVPEILINGQTGDTVIKINKDDILQLATKCYCKSLSFDKENYLFWNDLAVCYFLHSQSIKNDNDKRGELLKKASTTAMQCISIESNSRAWNLLGVIMLNEDKPNYSMVQHCFIKALNIDKSYAIAWCNLGIFYQIVGELILANEAFSKAQRADVSYPNCWVGQGLVAEIYNHSDALELFRHGVHLGFNKQSATSYAYFVCKSLLEPSLVFHVNEEHEQLQPVPFALDNLTWYTEYDTSDGCVWNLMGIFQERIGLLRSALESYEKAVELTKGNNNTNDKAKLNYGRTLIRFKQYEKAIEVFNSVKEASFKSIIGLALALYKNRDYQKSYQVYESCLNWLTDNCEAQSEILVVLASIAYICEGVEAAKVLLFQSIKLKDPSPWAFYATLALSLLNKDSHIVNLVMRELHYFNNPGNPDYISLMAYAHILQGDEYYAIGSAIRGLHFDPVLPKTWLLVARLILTFQHHKGNAAVACAQNAIEYTKIRDSLDLTKVMCLLSVGRYLKERFFDAVKMALKAVHLFPHVCEGYAVLGSALKKINRTECLEEIKKMILFCNPPEDMIEWAKTL